MIKIIKSLAIVAFVATIAIGGTIAYLSDTETSPGNTFVAGEFDLKIDSDCHFNGMDCVGGYWQKDGEDATTIACDCKWEATDLTEEKFFNLANLIPGDSGEATISMHVSGDDYYVRSKMDNVVNKDNGCNDPENEAGDMTCGNPGNDTSGELGANMDFAYWADMGTNFGYECPVGQPGCNGDPEEGDNILNSNYEYLSLSIVSGDDTTGEWTYVIDAPNSAHLSFRDGATYYLGVAWCVGDLSVDTSINSYAMTCDGSGVDSIIQSDSYSSDMTFEVVQATHNDPMNPFDI